MTEEHTETTETATTTPEEAAEERKMWLPKLDFHKLPGAETIGDLLENQMNHLKVLYEEWDKLETQNKDKLDHGIDEMARLAHLAVENSLDFIGKVRQNTIDWLEHGSNRLRHH